MKKLFLILLSIWAIYFYFWYLNFVKLPLTDGLKVVIIENWDSFSWLSKYFVSLNSIYYKIYLKNNPPDYELQAGMYEIEANANIATVINELKTPVANETRITLLEWRNIYDIDEYLTEKWLIKKGEYIEKVSWNFSEYKKYYEFIADTNTLEGFLYPDTYNINRLNFSVDDVITKQLNAFKAKVIDKMDYTYGSVELLDIVNLASIVEKEEKNKEAKPIVAGILKKRLDAGWMIWADATVCYPYKLTSEACKMVVSKYIYEKNTYNTRTMKWLPETPISNPSAETIFSVINSKKTEYWFYLHGSDGKIHYGVTNADHEANKKYLQ